MFCNGSFGKYDVNNLFEFIVTLQTLYATVYIEKCFQSKFII